MVFFYNFRKFSLDELHIGFIDILEISVLYFTLLSFFYRRFYRVILIIYKKGVNELIYDPRKRCRDFYQ